MNPLILVPSIQECDPGTSSAIYTCNHSQISHIGRWIPIKRSAPSGSTSRSSVAPKPRGPAAMWVGIPKDAGCWEGWRDFFDFLSHDILGRDGQSERSTAPNHTLMPRGCHAVPTRWLVVNCPQDSNLEITTNPFVVGGAEYENLVLHFQRNRLEIRNDLSKPWTYAGIPRMAKRA